MFKNVSDKPLLLWGADSQYAYRVVVQERSDDRDAGWTPEWRIEMKGLTESLEPGKSFELPVNLKGLRWQYAAKTKMQVKTSIQPDCRHVDLAVQPRLHGGAGGQEWSGGPVLGRPDCQRELVFRASNATSEVQMNGGKGS